MRVLQLNPILAAAGGVESYLTRVCPSIVRELGVEVTIGCAHPSPHPHLDEVVPVVVERGLASTTERERLRAIQSLITRTRPDLVQLNAWDDPATLAWLCGRVPTVQFVHSHYPNACAGESKFWRASQGVCERAVGPYCAIAPWIHQCSTRRPVRHLAQYAKVRRYMKEAAELRAYLVASDYMARELMLNGRASQRVRNVGLPAPLWEHPVAPIPRGRPRVLFVGRLYDYKGPHLLAEATRGLDCEVVFVGAGPMEESLRREAHVRVLGWRDGEALRDEYDAATLVVVPSVWPEPFGLVGLEAMGRGRPVVAFDSGGVSEWLCDGTTGALVPRGDVSALRRAISGLLVSSDRCVTMGDAARESVRAFSMEAHLSRLEAAWTFARFG